MNLKTECKECLIHTNSKEAAAHGNIAVAEIVTKNSTILLLLSKTDAGVAWRSPMLTLQQNGAPMSLPAVTGELLIQGKTLAEAAIKRIKETFNNTAYGVTYRVARGGVCEMYTNYFLPADQPTAR